MNPEDAIDELVNWQLTQGEGQPLRCRACHHYRGSHFGAGGCIVERVSGPPSGPDTTPSPADPHPGRVITVCGCKGFV